MHAQLDQLINEAWDNLRTKLKDDEIPNEAHDLIKQGEYPGNLDPHSVIWDYEIEIKNLVNRGGSAFEIAYSHPRILAAVAHVLRYNIKLSYLHVRQPQPGNGLQELHLDTYSSTVAERVHYFCNSIWMLDDFTDSNGATRIVPGTHKLEQQAWDVMDDHWAAHPEEIKICAPAGSVLVFDGHLWHGGTNNDDGTRRRGLFAAWVHREWPQLWNQRTLITDETKMRLLRSVRFLLDVD